MALRIQQLAREAHIQRVVALETASYPADEAASETQIRFRQQHAGAFFQAAFLPSTEGAQDHENDALVGFVNGTLTASEELEEHSMSQHDASGSTLCIHSVVVDAAYRRRGLASTMLQQYVDHVVEHQVDAFTTEPFQGNPAAVLVMPPSQFHKPTATHWVQRVAIENNLSETAYTAKRDASKKETNDDVVEYDLRWFSPECEVKLCGHGTLSAAFLLYQDGHVEPSQSILFHTLSGVLVCSIDSVASATGERKKLIQMDFPRGSIEPVAPGISKEQVAASIGVSPDSVVEMKQIGTTTDVLLHIDAAVFPSIRPDFAAIAQIDARALIVTAEVGANAQQVDFESRVFGPRLGVNEDPVTGSAHCGLVSYWSPRLNKTNLLAKQSSPVRGGYITVEAVANRPDRVLLKGEAVIALRGFMETTP